MVKRLLPTIAMEVSALCRVVLPQAGCRMGKSRRELLVISSPVPVQAIACVEYSLSKLSSLKRQIEKNLDNPREGLRATWDLTQ